MEFLNDGRAVARAQSRVGGRPTVITSSNREPAEWLTMTSDTLLAQSAVDRLTQGAHALVIEGPSWRQHASENRRTFASNA